MRIIYIYIWIIDTCGHTPGSRCGISTKDLAKILQRFLQTTEKLAKLGASLKPTEHHGQCMVLGGLRKGSIGPPLRQEVRVSRTKIPFRSSASNSVMHARKPIPGSCQSERTGNTVRYNSSTIACDCCDNYIEM